MAGRLSGGCFCGGIRYSSSTEMIAAWLCQCRDCQKFTGSGHSAGFALPRAAVSITGKAQFFEHKSDSGNVLARAMCPKCGSPVYTLNSAYSEIVFFRAGSLDDSSLFKPQMVTFAASAAPWDHVDPGVPRFPGMPPR